MAHVLSSVLPVIVCVVLEGCRTAPKQEFAPLFGAEGGIASGELQYRFGVQPMRPTRRIWERYSTLVDELNASSSGFKLRLVSAQTDETYNRKLREGKLDFAIVEPNHVLEAEPLGYKTIARAGNADRIAGVIAIRRDSGITRIADLKGRTIAFSSPDSLAGTMLVRLYLRNAGLRLDRSSTSRYVGSQESALVEVATHGADAAGVSRAGWYEFVDQNSFLSERLEPRWTTEELPGAAVMVGSGVTQKHIRDVQRSLLALKRTAQGRAALARAGFSEFRYGEEASYDVLWEFLANYARVFPPHPQPRVLQ